MPSSQKMDRDYSPAAAVHTAHLTKVLKLLQRSGVKWLHSEVLHAIQF